MTTSIMRLDRRYAEDDVPAFFIHNILYIANTVDKTLYIVYDRDMEEPTRHYSK